MFKLLASAGSLRLANGGRGYKFVVVDSCFQETIITGTGYIENYDIPMQIIRLYKRRNLNVAANLAAFYLHLVECGFGIRNLIEDDHLPNIEYVDKSLKYRSHYLPILKHVRLRKYFPHT
jgi:hypothetical protein